MAGRSVGTDRGWTGGCGRHSPKPAAHRFDPWRTNQTTTHPCRPARGVAGPGWSRAPASDQRALCVREPGTVRTWALRRKLRAAYQALREARGPQQRFFITLAATPTRTPHARRSPLEHPRRLLALHRVARDADARRRADAFQAAGRRAAGLHAPAHDRAAAAPSLRTALEPQARVVVP